MWASSGLAAKPWSLGLLARNRNAKGTPAFSAGRSVENTGSRLHRDSRNYPVIFLPGLGRLRGGRRTHAGHIVRRVTGRIRQKPKGF
jgi:hypothetical protein